MPPQELDKLKLQWLAVTNDEMPAAVQRWPHWKVESAIRLLVAGLVKWCYERQRLKMAREPNVSDLIYWNDVLRSEVVI